MTIEKDTTLTVAISGDLQKTITKNITFGENATITVTPAAFYIEGIVEVPYEVRNLGVLETNFNVTFQLGSETISRPVYLPVGAFIEDYLTFNLTKGQYVLDYSTPFENGNVTLQVQSPARFIVTALPENMTFKLGQTANMSVTFKNVGGTGGEVAVNMTVPGITEDYQRTWIEPGQVGNVTFTFQVPNDLEENYYKVVFTIEGKEYQVKFFVEGAKIAVNASLDKTFYNEGENATLTLTFGNLRNMNLSLFSRVKLADYDTVEYFNLTALGTKTLIFSVPVVFDAGKLLYTVYMLSGRALYINALYVYAEPPGSAGIALYTDKQVYEIGENVTVCVNATKAGRLTMTAPNLNVNTTIPVGFGIFNFKVPDLRSGTYPIEYIFEGYSSSYPIDVIGYSGRIIG
jgi:hypothetical protein